jgi:hypothetical protein
MLARFLKNRFGDGRPRKTRRSEKTSARRHRRPTRLSMESLESREMLDAAPHNIAAGLLNVVQNDTGNATTSVTVTAPYAFNGFQVRAGSNRGDYNVQIGSSPDDDVPNGILITNITETSRCGPLRQQLHRP